MTRRRKQNGSIVQKSGQWFLRVYESRNINGEIVRIRAAKPLGPVTTRSKYPPAEIKAIADDVLTSINRGTVSPEMVVTLRDFVERVYLPWAKDELKPSTAASYRRIWAWRLKPLCADVWLRDVGTRDAQTWLDEIVRANSLSKQTVSHVKSLLSGIFKSALQLGYIPKGMPNPMRETTISTKHTRPPEETYAYSLDEVLSIIAAVPEPQATVVAVAAFTGLRRGEIQGLEWADYRDGELHIVRSVWEGKVTDPKTGASADSVPVISLLRDRLEMHRLREGNRQSGAIFRNAKGGYMTLNNVLNRVILPILKNKAIEWHGWHAFRRGLATNLHDLGIDDLTIQRILRHSNVNVTRKSYIKTLPKQVTAAMENLEVQICLTDSQRTTTDGQPAKRVFIN